VGWNAGCQAVAAAETGASVSIECTSIISTANKIIGLSESLSRGLPRFKISSAARSDLIALLLLCAVGGSCSFAAAGGD